MTTRCVDAERYRWLREHPGRVQWDSHGAGWFVVHTGDVRRRVSFLSECFDTLDAAVDYALAGKAGDVAHDATTSHITDGAR